MNNELQTGFDYGLLDPTTATQTRAAAERIKVRMKRTAEDIIEIGRDLQEVKAFLGYGQFGPWIEAEFGFTGMTAARFMQVADRFGKSNNLLDFKPAILYALAAPSTPAEVIEKATEKAESGEQVTVKDVARWKKIAEESTAKLDLLTSERDKLAEREAEERRKKDQYARDLMDADKARKALEKDYSAKLQAQQQAAKDAESVHREHLDEMRVRIAEEERNRPRTDEEVAKHRAEIKKLKDEEATIQIAINESTKERQKLEAELLDARKATALRDKVLSDFGQAAIRFRDDCIRMTGVAEALRSIPITDELYSQIETVRTLAREVLQAMEDATSVSV